NIADRLIIGYFSQDVGEMHGRSALEEVKAGAGRVSKLAAEITKMEKRLEEYGEAQLEFEQRGGYDLDSRAKAILTGLGIGPDSYDNPVESFSGGWKMR